MSLKNIKVNKNNLEKNDITSSEHLINNDSDNESSSESSKKDFDMIHFESMKINCMKTSYYTIDMINQMNFHEIYNILLSLSYLIFVDNDKLLKKNKKSILTNCFNKYFYKNTSMTDIELPGCTFLPYEAVDIIKKNIHILNNNLLNAENDSVKVYKN